MPHCATPVDRTGTCENVGRPMDAMTNDFGEVLLWSFWFFIWIAAIMVWFRCLFDMFGDHTLSGWGKAGRTLLLIFVPWLGALIYVIARGPEHDRTPDEQSRGAAGRASRLHQAGREHSDLAGRPDLQRQGAPRLRRHQPGRISTL